LANESARAKLSFKACSLSNCLTSSIVLVLIATVYLPCLTAVTKILWVKIYQEFYHGIVHIAMEGCHIKMWVKCNL
jgi:hypothetical protein